MRGSQLAALALAGIALAGSAMAVAQSSNLVDKQNRINGYVDLKTGAFHPTTEASATPATTTYTLLNGVVEVTIVATITADTAKVLPAGYTILCDVDLSANLPDNFTEIGAAPATVSGNVATCNVYVPYAWMAASGTPQDFAGTYKITASYAPGGDTQPLTDFNVIRQSTGQLYNSTGNVFVIPANGTTTYFKFETLL